MILDSWKTWTALAGSIVSLSLGARAFAESGSIQEPPENKEGIEATGWKRMPGSKHFFVTAELLYWQAFEEGLDYSATVDQRLIGGSIIKNTAKVHEVGFQYDPGVRLGIGRYIPHSEWDLYAQWTYFRTHAGDTELGHGPTARQSPTHLKLLVPTLITVDQNTHLSNLDSAQSDWSITLHNAVVEIGRSFSLNKHLALRPNMGVMAAWINQEQHVKYNHTTSGLVGDANVFMKVTGNNNFFGIGGKGGLDTRWPIACGWSLFGDAAAALLWGHFNLRDRVYTDFNFIRNLKNHLHQLKTYLHLAIGIRWDAAVKNNRYHWGFHLGYEFNEWFGQNMRYKLIAVREDLGPTIGSHLSALTRSPGNLLFQGFTLGARLDF